MPPAVEKVRPPRCLVCDRDLADSELATCHDVHAACPAQPEVSLLEKVRAAAPVAGWPDSRAPGDLVCPRCAALVNDIVIYESRLADVTQQLVTMVTATMLGRVAASETTVPLASDKPKLRRPRKVPPKKNKSSDPVDTPLETHAADGERRLQQACDVPPEVCHEAEDEDDPSAVADTTNHGSPNLCSGSQEPPEPEQTAEEPVSQTPQEAEQPLPVSTDVTATVAPTMAVPGPPAPKRQPISSLFEVTAGARPYTCQVCRKQYADKSSIYAHVKLHLGVRPFRCTECPRTFVRRSDLTTHAAVHSEERPYLCPSCPATFRQQSALIAHRKIHSGERNHRCQLCGKAFRTGHELRAHSETHAGLKTHCCDVCGGMFSTAKILVRHKTIHTGHKPHMCTVCGQAFRVRPALRDHMRVHTGERPFVCEVCGKRFARPQILASHRRVHTGERPYVCPRCGKGFSQCTPLKKHVQSGVCCARVSTAETALDGLAAQLAAPATEPPACPVCFLRLPTVQALEEHRRDVHDQGVTAATAALTVNVGWLTPGAGQ